MRYNRGDLDAGQHILVSTASGLVRADLSEMVSIVLFGLFEAVLFEQATLPSEQRQRYLVLIDEFQVYLRRELPGHARRVTQIWQQFRPGDAVAGLPRPARPHAAH